MRAAQFGRRFKGNRNSKKVPNKVEHSTSSSQSKAESQSSGLTSTKDVRRNPMRATLATTGSHGKSPAKSKGKKDRADCADGNGRKKHLHKEAETDAKRRADAPRHHRKKASGGNSTPGDPKDRRSRHVVDVARRAYDGVYGDIGMFRDPRFA